MLKWCGGSRNQKLGALATVGHCHNPNGRPLSGRPGEDIALQNKFSCLKHDALSRGLRWELSWNFYKSLALSPCSSCGTPPSQVHYLARRHGNYQCRYTGIDRVENTVGYIPSNVRPMCWFCNSAKHASSDEDFQSWVSRLVDFRSGR